MEVWPNYEYVKKPFRFLKAALVCTMSIFGIIIYLIWRKIK